MYWVAHMPGKSRDSQEGFRMKGRCLFIGDWWCKPVASRQFYAIHHPDRFKCSVSCLSTWWACKHGLRSACLNPPRHANSHLGCKVPRRLSLNVRKEGGKNGFGSPVTPSHGPLRFVTSHSHMALAYVRDQSAKKREAPKKGQETDH